MDQFPEYKAQLAKKAEAAAAEKAQTAAKRAVLRAAKQSRKKQPGRTRVLPKARAAPKRGAAKRKAPPTRQSKRQKVPPVTAIQSLQTGNSKFRWFYSPDVRRYNRGSRYVSSLLGLLLTSRGREK